MSCKTGTLNSDELRDFRDPAFDEARAAVGVRERDLDGSEAAVLVAAGDLVVDALRVLERLVAFLVGAEDLAPRGEDFRCKP